MIAISSDTPAPLDSVESFFDIVWEDAVALDAAEHNSSCSTRSPITTTYYRNSDFSVSIAAHSHDTRLRCHPLLSCPCPPTLKLNRYGIHTR